MPNLSRKALDVLRTADKPLTATDIAKAALEGGSVVADAAMLKASLARRANCLATTTGGAVLS